MVGEEAPLADGMEALRLANGDDEFCVIAHAAMMGDLEGNLDSNGLAPDAIEPVCWPRWSCSIAGAA